MSRGNGWRWAFVPRWLLESEAFLCLEPATADLLFRLYLTCDAYGRFQAGPHALRRITGIFDSELTSKLKQLNPIFVQTYEVDSVSYGRIEGYDEDAPGELIRKRGTPINPGPPNVRQTSANDPPDVRNKYAEIDKNKKEEIGLNDYPF